ncbi:MAG: hypothetical protein J5X22_17075 [Candidatus Accumulibacter sp.]|uniref:hypothetical protein n=1 Tax=Accumulibacter sp. TaxID=2053492 RepID=UPI001AC9835B|nr:hypothetical protein [Accumulibacter sp.]MBN8519992.1 hypothetical protein [Accumulibacter sp.]MBO3712133.1 hypothetical protein [Accumulibacter sp.]
MRLNPPPRQRSQAVRRRAERLALAVVENHGAPISLREVALALGWSPQRAARVLLRLATAGEVSREVVEFKDTNYRPRQRVIYRPCPKIPLDLPAWLNPIVHEDIRGARRVEGRYR